MNWDSIWVSVAPLIFLNLIFTCTVLIFRSVYRKTERLKEVEERHASKFLNRWMREYWLWLTSPVVRFFIWLKITPNIITVIGVILSCLSAFFLGIGHMGLGGWLMVFAASFDIFDGHVARKTNQVTLSGAFFDSVMDRISEGVVFIGLAFYYRYHWGLFFVLVALIGSVLVSYSRARGDSVGVAYAGGSMQRPERIVYLGVGAIFVPVVSLVIRPFINWADPFHLYLFPLCFVAWATCATSYHRISHIMGILDAKQQAEKE